jgi:hypothetical protein
MVKAEKARAVYKIVSEKENLSEIFGWQRSK